MEHNLCEHRSGLLLSDLYSATPGFLPAVGWQADTFGKILVEKRSGAVAVAAAVRRVLPTRLDCGPSSNFTGQGRGSLKTAKFQLQLGKPVGTCYADDFDKTINALTKIQDRSAFTPCRVNLLLGQGSDASVRFARSVFEKRVSVFL